MGAVYSPDAGAAWSEPLLSGDAGIAQTIALMDQAVDDAARDPWVRSVAGRLIAGIDPMQLERQARRIWEWFVDHVRFVRDGVGQEIVSSARWTLTHGFGDCDDMVVALRGMLAAIGIVTRTVTVAVQPGQTAFSHVYLEADLGGGRWIPLDAARPQAQFGRGPAHYSRKQVWSANGDRGLGRTLNGDLGFEWGTLTNLITAGGQSAAQIISASRANPNLLYPGGGALPGGYQPSAAVAGGLSVGGLSPTTVLLLGAVALMVLMKR